MRIYEVSTPAFRLQTLERILEMPFSWNAVYFLSKPQIDTNKLNRKLVYILELRNPIVA